MTSVLLIASPVTTLKEARARATEDKYVGAIILTVVIIPRKVKSWCCRMKLFEWIVESDFYSERRNISRLI